MLKNYLKYSRIKAMPLVAFIVILCLFVVPLFSYSIFAHFKPPCLLFKYTIA